MNSSDRLPGRRRFMRRVATGVGASLLGPASLKVSAVTARPSVLLFGSDRPSPSPAAPRMHPGIARLAREGFCFESFRTHYPFVQPGWGDLLAGCWDQDDRERDATGRTTMASAFADAGYETVFVDIADARAQAIRRGFARNFRVRADQSSRLLDLVAGAHDRSEPLFLVVSGDGEAVTLDGALARVLERIDTASALDDSIIVYVSPFARVGSACGSGCSPLIIRAWHRCRDGARSGVPMNVLDVAPTVCGVAGLGVPVSFGGFDYSALATVRSR